VFRVSILDASFGLRLDFMFRMFWQQASLMAAALGKTANDNR